MAVYTEVDEDALARFVAGYGRGALMAWEGVSEGVENTTYFVSLREGRARREYVLTLFEQLDGEAVQAYAGFTAGFAAAGLPVPHPLLDRAGRSWASLAGKPAILVPRVPGRHPVRPSLAACRQIGGFLGRAHALALASGWHWDGPRSPVWLRGLADELLPRLTGADRELLSSELAFWDSWRHTAPDLPRALVHGDLFRDNSLFQRGRLTGVIDFFSAGTDYLLFDLAVVVNDWCSAASGELAKERVLSIVSAYAEVRRLNLDERRLWPAMLRLAALRFWVSRLAASLASPAAGTLLPVRDPAVYQRILTARRERMLTFG